MFAGQPKFAGILFYNLIYGVRKTDSYRLSKHLLQNRGRVRCCDVIKEKIAAFVTS